MIFDQGSPAGTYGGVAVAAVLFGGTILVQHPPWFWVEGGRTVTPIHRVHSEARRSNLSGLARDLPLTLKIIQLFFLVRDEQLSPDLERIFIGSGTQFIY